MGKFDDVDYFTDPAFVEDPYPFFADLRSKCPVHPMPKRGVLAVTGHQEAIPIFNNTRAFSSAVSVGGPIPPLPFTPEGSDITPQIQEHRAKFPFADLVVTMDDERHATTRSLLLRLFTPRRLAANEAYMKRVADEHIDQFIRRGSCEFYAEYSKPFAALVIADLLGVPEEDRDKFKAVRANAAPPSSIDPDAKPFDFYEFVNAYFLKYVQERSRAPSDDIISELAMAKLPDGSSPSTMDVVNVAAMLFGAGQGTIAHLLATSMRMLCEFPELQQQLRNDRDLIPDFVEEALRYDGPIKNSFRLVRRDTVINGERVPAGTCVMLANAAMNRDPRRYDDPDQFKLGRPHVRKHLAFGRGAHTCPGASLARAEARISLERILDRLKNIRISDSEHGPAGARKFAYEPTYILRGLSKLHLEFD